MRVLTSINFSSRYHKRKYNRGQQVFFEKLILKNPSKTLDNFMHSFSWTINLLPICMQLYQLDNKFLLGSCENYNKLTEKDPHNFSRIQLDACRNFCIIMTKEIFLAF